MNASEILALVGQFLAVLPTLIAAGVDITQRLEQLAALSQAGAAGTVTNDDVAKIRAQFDADLDDFNTPMS